MLLGEGFEVVFGAEQRGAKVVSEGIKRDFNFSSWVDFGHDGTCQIEVSTWPAMFETSTGCSFRGPNDGDGSGWWQPPLARSESPGLVLFAW